MFIKLGIIGAVVLLAVIVFPNEIYQLFPETSTKIVDTTKNDLGKIKDNAIQKTQMTIGEGGKLANEQVKDFTERTSDNLADSLANSISESINNFSESAQQTLGIGGVLGDAQTNNNESQSQRDSSPSAQYSRSTTQSTTQSTTESPFSTVVTEEKTIQTFDTLSLESSQQSDDNVMLHYEDSSGKTISVTVTLRTTEKELFTGIFYSSLFETYVQDITKTSYFIDMVIEHEEYGTISSSVFIPVDKTDTVINGVFSNS